MRTRALPIALYLLPFPAAAATFAPVHAVDGDVYVELSVETDALAKTAGPARRIAGDRTAFVRSLRGAPGEERAVRLVAEDGVCEGHIAGEVLLGLYESMEEDGADLARWMVAAKVRGCHGAFSIAVVDPPRDARPRALGPADERAAAAVDDAKRLLGSSRVLGDARDEWRPMFGDAEEVHESAWRVGETTFALVDVVLTGGECGSTVRVRTIVTRDREGRSGVAVQPARVDLDESAVAIADLDSDGHAELVTRRIDDAVRVVRLGDDAVLLDAGEVPFFGCPC